MRISGDDRYSFLQGLITQDIHLLGAQPAIYSAMCTPQGKFLADFFITKSADGEALLLDVDQRLFQPLHQSLKRYKLRSKVALEDVSDSHVVVVGWEDSPQPESAYADPRLAALGWRQIIEDGNPVPDAGTPEAYETHRLSLGVPDGVVDATERFFILELGLDQLHGVSFTKGCFVGQEPTARMHHRSILRKCLYQVRTDSDHLPSAGTDIIAGEVTVGQMRSSFGSTGLAMCRIERVSEALAQGMQCMADKKNLTLTLPEYMRSKIEALYANQETIQSG